MIFIKKFSLKLLLNYLTYQVQHEGSHSQLDRGCNFYQQRCSWRVIVFESVQFQDFMKVLFQIFHSGWSKSSSYWPAIWMHCDLSRISPQGSNRFDRNCSGKCHVKWRSFQLEQKCYRSAKVQHKTDIRGKIKKIFNWFL